MLVQIFGLRKNRMTTEIKFFVDRVHFTFLVYTLAMAAINRESRPDF